MPGVPPHDPNRRDNRAQGGNPLNPNLHIVILAAGKGTRMKSALPKVLHRVAGIPMIDYALATAAGLSPATTTIVVGHEADRLTAALARHSGLTFVVQEPQLGTAHALLTAEPVLKHATGTLVLLSGDVPFLSAENARNTRHAPPRRERGGDRRHRRRGSAGRLRPNHSFRRADCTYR